MSDLDVSRRLTDVSRRLMQVFNSIRQASIAPWSVTNAKTFAPLVCNETMAGNITAFLGTTVDNCRDMVLTTASTSRLVPMYKSSPIWICLLFLASLVLFVLGISIFLQMSTSVPDILGYVSTVTRDNPYIDLPSAATALEGSKRARALQDMRIQLMDVRPDDEIGYLAIKSIANGDVRTIGRVNKKRRYE